MRIQIAIAVTGDIHIWTGHEMPAAGNIVDLEVDRRDGMYVIPAAKAGTLRELLGTGSVAAHAGIKGPSRLDKILAMAERLADEIRAEVEDEIDAPKPPGL